MPFHRRGDSDDSSVRTGVFGSLRGHKKASSKGRRTSSIITALHVPSRQELTNLAREDPNALPEEPSDTSSSATGLVNDESQGPDHVAKSVSPATDSVPPTPGVSTPGLTAHDDRHAATQHTQGGSTLSLGHSSVKPAAGVSQPPQAESGGERQNGTVAADATLNRNSVDLVKPGMVTQDSAASIKSAHVANGTSSGAKPSTDHASIAGDRPHAHEVTFFHPNTNTAPPLPSNPSTPTVATASKPDDFEGGVYRHPDTHEEAEVGGDHKTKAVVQPRKSGTGQEDANDSSESFEGTHHTKRAGTFDSTFSDFPTASLKRNAEFHSVFPEAPADEYLIEDFGCSAIREHFHTGRLYLAENNLYFYASIFGWVTSYVLPFSEITSIEKRMTALVIPNGIQIVSTKEKILFTSFLSRDSAYDKIVQIWKLSNPSLTDNEELDTEDKESTTSSGGHRHHHNRFSARARLRRKIMERINQHAQQGSIDEDGGETPAEKIKHEASSRAATDSKGGSGAKSKAGGGKSHPKTECNEIKTDSTYTTVVMDETFGTCVETMHNLLFTTDFVKGFLTHDQKLINVEVSDWSKANEQMRRDVTYIKPLNGSVGPKQTKCMIEDKILHQDFDHHTTTVTTTRTPDVPSGNSFVVKTRTCLVWGGGWRTRVVVTCGVEWSGRSFLKSVIDKAAIDGQKDYYKSLTANIRKYMKDHSHEFGGVDEKESDDAYQAEETSKGSAGSNEKASPASGLQQYLAPLTNALSNTLGTVVEQVQNMSPMSLVITGLLLVYIVFHGFHFGSTEPSIHQQLSSLGKTEYDQDHTVFEVVKHVMQQLRHPHLHLTHGHGLHGVHHPPPSVASVPPPNFMNALNHDPVLAHSNAASEINRLIAWVDFQERQMHTVRNELATLLANHKALSEKLKHRDDDHAEREPSASSI